MPILLARTSGKRTSFCTPSAVESTWRSVVIERICSTPSVSTLGGAVSLLAASSEKAPTPRAAEEYWSACSTVRHS